MSKSTSKSRMGCVSVVLVILLLLCVGAIGWSYFSSSKPAEPIITILSPANGSTAILNSPLSVEAAGFYDDGMQRLELYADGALVAVQDSTLENGSNPLLFSDAWIPSTVGRHALMLRGYTKDDQVIDSLVILVDVGEQLEEVISANIDELPIAEGASTNPTLEDIANSTGISIERLRELNPSIVPNAPIPPGTVVEIPRPAPSPSTTPVVPPPPRVGTTLSAPQISNLEILSCSQTKINWADVSNENGYGIYRMGPGDSRFIQISEQPANTSTYTDSILHSGTYYYQIEARGSGSNRALGTMRSFTSAAECTPPSASGTQNLILSLFTIDTAEAFDGVYCYSSVNGSRYERAPREGVLRANADGLTYNLVTQMPNRGSYILSNTPSTGLITLAVECWGRRGAESLLIGRFSASHASSEWDGRDLLQTALNPNTQYASNNNAGGYAMRIRYRITQNWLTSGIPPVIDPSIIGSIIFPPESLRPIEGAGIAIPAPTNVRIGQVGTEFCEDATTANPNIIQRVCSTFFSPALQWDWRGHELLDERGLTGYRVIVRVTDTISGVTSTTHTWTVTPGTTKRTTMPAFPTSMRCGYRIGIYVQAYIGGESSPESAPLIIMTTPPCTSSVRVLIRFESLRVGNPADATRSINSGHLDFGDICILCLDNRFEIVNGFSVNSQSYIPSRHAFGALVSPLGTCNYGTFLCPDAFITYSGPQLAEFNLPTVRLLNWLPQDNQSLTIRLSFWDYDLLDANDPWCLTSTELPARSAAEWQRIDQRVTLSDARFESRCTFQIYIRGEANIAVGP